MFEQQIKQIVDEINSLEFGIEEAQDTIRAHKVRIAKLRKAVKTLTRAEAQINGIAIDDEDDEEITEDTVG